MFNFREATSKNARELLLFYHKNNFLWCDTSFILLVILLRSLSKIGRKEWYWMWLSHIINEQPTTLLKLPVPLPVHFQAVNPSTSFSGKNIQFSPAYKPQIFLHLLWDVLVQEDFHRYCSLRVRPPALLPQSILSSQAGLSPNTHLFHRDHDLLQWTLAGL